MTTGSSGNVREDGGVLMVEMSVGHVVTRVGRSLVRRDLDTKWTVSVVALESVYVSRARRPLMAIPVVEPPESYVQLNCQSTVLTVVVPLDQCTDVETKRGTLGVSESPEVAVNGTYRMKLSQ